MSTWKNATRTSASSTPCAVWVSSPSRSASMPLLIKGRAIVEDRWALLREAASLVDVPPNTPAIVPLALWQSEHDALAAGDEVGVGLKPSDDPDALAGDVARLPLI